MVVYLVAKRGVSSAVRLAELKVGCLVQVTVVCLAERMGDYLAEMTEEKMGGMWDKH
jgi:hypothetical protein